LRRRRRRRKKRRPPALAPKRKKRKRFLLFRGLDQFLLLLGVEIAALVGIESLE
jgi:hypothetical protein